MQKYTDRRYEDRIIKTLSNMFSFKPSQQQIDAASIKKYKSFN